MDRVPVIVTGQEPDWLREQFKVLVREGTLEAEFAFEQRCPKGAGPCVILTDDLRCSGLRRLLFECVDRTRGDRILVLAWDEARHAVELLRIPLVRLYFPLDDPVTSSTVLAGALQKGSPARLVYELDPCLPASLAVGLRIALNRAGDPFGPPPPRSAAALALLVPCASDTLYRSSAAAGIDLAKVLAASRVRWIKLVGGDETRDTEMIAQRLGYASGRSVRRLVKSEVGTSPSELRKVSLEHLDARLRTLVSARNTS
ncbi:MAG: hypothetical protein RLN75_03110 [Longimicrobiales bacterium]